MVLSDEAYSLALAIAPKISGCLSIIGSTFILRDVLSHRKGGHNRRGPNGNNLNQQNQLPTTSRVILNMSVADLGTSFCGHFLSTWMVPDTYENAALAAGNYATCRAQSFFWELFFHAGIWANAMLAVAYWLSVCREMSESKLRQWKWQALLLGLPWVIALANAVPKVILGKSTFNGYWWCELAAGSTADNLFDQSGAGIATIIVITSMVSLIRFVYLRERKMDRFASSDEHYHREITIQVTYQGLFYIMLWLGLAIPSYVITIVDDLPKGYVVFWACLFPLQGLGNTLVFFRPKFVAVRRRERNSDTRVSIVTSAAQVLDLSVPDRLARLPISVTGSVRGFAASAVRNVKESQTKKPLEELSASAVQNGKEPQTKRPPDELAEINEVAESKDFKEEIA